MTRVLLCLMLLLPGATWAQVVHSPTTAAALQTDLTTDAVYGDTISLDDFTVYTGNFTIPDKGANANCASGYITVTTDNAASFPAVGVRLTSAHTGMAKIVTDNSVPAITFLPGARCWKFIGVEMKTTAAASGAAGTTGTYNMVFDGYLANGIDQISNVADVATDITYDRVLFNVAGTGGVARCLTLNGATQVVKESRFIRCARVGAEGAGMGGWNGPGPFTITNNYIEGSSQCVLFGGANSGITNVIPSDGLVQYNFCTRPMTWAEFCVTGAEVGCNGAVYGGIPYNIKVGFELKAGRRWTFDHNILENSWAMGQDGHLFLFQNLNDPGGGNSWNLVQDVVVTNNLIRNANKGITIAGHIAYSGSPMPSNDSGTLGFRIENNLFSNIHATAYGNDAFGGACKGQWAQLSAEALNVQLIHNTVDNTTCGARPIAVMFASYGPPYQQLTGLVMRDNFWRSNDETALFGDNGQYGTNALNSYVSDGSGGTTAVFLNNVIATDEATAFPATTVKISSAAFEAIWPNQATGDYRVAVGSAYKAGGVSDASDGTDVGVNLCLLPDPNGDGRTTFACDATSGIGRRPSTRLRIR